MNALTPAPDPLRRTEGALHTRRCVRHGEREAAARCPACERFFCRECVVEHDGRLLCVQCLERALAAAQPARDRWRRVRETGLVCAAVAMAWLAYYTMGSLLLKLPPAFHEGTIWNVGDRPHS